ncbi:MAG: GvpL/GvpF family gas vesicle protein [Bacteroidota bacterium]
MPQPNLPAAVADHPLVAELSKQLNPLLTSMLVVRALDHVGAPKDVAAQVLDEAPEQVLAVAQAAEQSLAATVIADMQEQPAAWAEAVVARLDFGAPALRQVYEQVKARVLQQMVEQALQDLSTALTHDEAPTAQELGPVAHAEVAEPQPAEVPEQVETVADVETIEIPETTDADAEPTAFEEPTPTESEAAETLPEQVSEHAQEEADLETAPPAEVAVQTAYLGPQPPAAEAPTDDFFSLDDLEDVTEAEHTEPHDEDAVEAAGGSEAADAPAKVPEPATFSEEDVAEAVHEAIAAEVEDEALATALDEQTDDEAEVNASSAPEATDTHDEAEAPSADAAELRDAPGLTKVDVPAHQPIYPERYMYAISIDEQDLLSLIELPEPVIEDGQYEIIRQGDLSAIVSTVPADVFSPDALRTKLSDAEWMTHYVGRHEAVVAAVAEKMPTMPLRFATVLPDRDAVQDVLREHEAEWKARVRSLHQTATFQVRLVRDDEHVRTLVVEQSERVVFFATELEGATGEGAADLRQRMLGAIEEEMAQRTGTTAQRLAEVLEQHAVVSRGLPTGDGVAWHQAYLVGQTDLSLFTNEVETLQREYEGTGFTVVAQGPQWPYAFVPSVARPAAVSQAA